LTPILCYSFSNHTTQSADVIPVINEGKIDIATVVFNFQTKDLGTLTDSPTKSDILFYLTYYITDSTYNDVMNELNISTPTIQDQIYTITASVKPSSRTYTGAVNLTYQLKAKVDIATIFTENLKQSLNQSDLLDFAQNTINNYFLNLVYSQYTTDNISVNWNQIQIRDVDYTSSEAKHNQAGSILIEPVNDSNAYTGSATITFPEIFSTLQISNFAYTATTQTFTAPKTGNYILEA
jgi:hypothetical protein